MLVTELVPIKFQKILQAKTYCCIVLGNDEKKFGIYTDLNNGKAIQDYLTESEKLRPSTHDLLSMIFRGLDVKVRQVVINGLDETIYLARLFLEQKNGEILNIVEIDARPSDCVALAIIHKAPLFCSREVFDQTVAVFDE